MAPPSWNPILVNRRQCPKRIQRFSKMPLHRWNMKREWNNRSKRRCIVLYLWNKFYILCCTQNVKNLIVYRSCNLIKIPPGELQLSKIHSLGLATNVEKHSIPEFSRNNHGKSILETGRGRIDTRRWVLLRCFAKFDRAEIVGAFSGRVRDMLLKRWSQSSIVKRNIFHRGTKRERGMVPCHFVHFAFGQLPC